MKNILQICQDVAAVVCVQAPTTLFGSTGQNEKIFLSVANDALNGLLRYGDWQELTKDGVLRTVAGKSDYPIASFCPDFYQLGDKYVLTFSPMGSGDHTSVYLTGDFDYKTGKFDWHISGEMDWGFDFYAPQSMVAPDGRRLIVAWANEWEWMPLFKDWGPTYQEGWCGFFNVIREVRMCKDGTLAFVPVEEMEKIRENKFTQREIQITETPQQLKAGDGISFEMKFTLDLEETDADRVELKLRCGKEKESRCIFDLKNGELLVDRSCADGWSVGTSRSVLKVSEKSLDVHIFSDQSSLEIFTDQYRNNHSNNIFAGNDQDAISISAFGGRAVIRDYEAYGLQECFN